MKRLVLIVFLISLLLIPFSAQAADLSVTVTCATPPDADGAIVLWIGYRSSNTLENSGFGYIGNAAFGGDVQAGDYPHFAEFYAAPDEHILFWAEGFAGGEHVYAEAWYGPGDVVPACDEQPPDSEPPTLDDQGVVNNPNLNPRSNSCYSSGQICTTEAEWETGYYRIREEYWGQLTRP